VRLRRRGEEASTLDLLVAGLGNPGREYERTRHNVGWLVADELARRHGGSFRSKFSGKLAEVRASDRRLALLKPETYMNESGRSVGAAARFFKTAPEHVLLVHDDVDLAEGRAAPPRPPRAAPAPPPPPANVPVTPPGGEVDGGRLAVDPSDPSRLVVAYWDGRPERRGTCLLARSSDGGRTWA